MDEAPLRDPGGEAARVPRPRPPTPLRRAATRPPRAPVAARARHAAPRTALVLGPLLARTFRVLLRTAPAILPVALLLFVPVALGIVELFHRDFVRAEQAETLGEVRAMARSLRGTAFLSIVAPWFVGLLLQCVVAAGVYRHLQGRSAGLAGSLAGLSRFGNVLLASLLILLCVWGVLFATALFGFALGPLGLPLLVVGVGLALSIYCSFFVGVQATIVEPIGPGRALSRSAFLTAGSRWRVFAVVAMVYGAQFLGNLLIDNVLLPDQEDWEALRNALYLQFGWQAVLAAFHAVVAVVMYADLRRSVEGVGLDELLKVFE